MVTTEFKTTVELSDYEIDTLIIALKFENQRLDRMSPQTIAMHSHKMHKDALQSIGKKMSKAHKDTYTQWLMYQEHMAACTEEPEPREEEEY